MFLDSIKGMEKIFMEDMARPANMLVSGSPGSMKTLFCFSLMLAYLKNHKKECGLYITLEESSGEQLKNIKKFGLTADGATLDISDMAELREEVNYDEISIDMPKEELAKLPDDQLFRLLDDENPIDFFDLILKDIKTHKKENPALTVVTIDSLGALYSLMREEPEEMRKKMFHFFKILEKLDLYVFMIMERGKGAEAQIIGGEGYLADGIIELGMKRKKGQLMRSIQVEKMRGCEHRTEKFLLGLPKGQGFQVLGPLG